MTDSRSQLPRGALYLSLGQGAFLLSGYVLHALLARWLAPSLYGIFGVSMAVLGWAEITVNNGVPSALQRLLPDASLSEESIRRASVRGQAVISIGVFLVLFLAAPWLAALLNDPELTGYLRLAFLDILAMGAYGYYRGMLNGYRAFPQLALTILGYALTKLAAICLLVYLGFGVQGALIGNVISSLGGLIVGFFWTRRQQARPTANPAAGEVQQSQPDSFQAGRAIGEREVLAFAVPTVLFTLASNVLLGLDLMGVKALIGDADQVGYYTAAVNLANAPRLVLLAFSFALLPSLSHAIASGDRDQTRRYLRQVIHLLALVLLPILALVTATARPLVTFVFSETYRPAAPILTILIFTYSVYTVYITLVNTLLAENRPGWALAIPAALLPVAVVLIWLGVERLGVLGAASASLLSVGVAALITIGYVFRGYKPALGGRSLVRIAGAALAIWAVARLWAPTGLVLVVAYGLLAGLYLGLLLVLGEVKLQDLVQARQWFRRLRADREV